jgi:hypothetical protein
LNRENYFILLHIIIKIKNIKRMKNEELEAALRVLAKKHPNTF